MPQKIRERAKYIHLMYGKDLKFIGPMIAMFFDPEAGFNINEHLFITPYKNVYSDLYPYKASVILDESGVNLLKKYAGSCKWLIAHGSPPKKQVIFTSRKILAKTIFRYWGGSRTTHIKLNSLKPIHYLPGLIKIKLFKYILQSYAAIGVANQADVIDLTNILSTETDFYMLDYKDREQCDSLIAILNKLSFLSKEKDTFNVLLGHRGKSEGNHIENLKRLRHLSSKYTRIYIPLSYGDDDYIEAIEQYVSDNNLHNVILIKDFMPYEKYVELLGNMDCCLFDGETSYALGNIQILVYLHKTIYLKRGGILAYTFEKEGIPYKDIEQIGKMSDQEFYQLFTYDIPEECTIVASTFNNVVDSWKKLLTDFD